MSPPPCSPAPSAQLLRRSPPTRLRRRQVHPRRLHLRDPKQATKQQLIDILRGNLPGGPPAVFFTGSHGAEYPLTDPALQRRMQGSLFTQEWVRDTPAGRDNLFSAEDIPADAHLQGTIAFLFACYSGGCPTDNNYYFNPDGSKIPIAPSPLIAALPQALLRRGALAVVAHVDMAFPYAFQDVTGTPQVQAVRDPLTYLMQGRRAGFAADCLSDRWSCLCAQLTESAARTASSDPTAPQPLNPAARTSLTIARDDAATTSSSAIPPPNSASPTSTNRRGSPHLCLSSPKGICVCVCFCSCPSASRQTTTIQSFTK